MLRFSSSYENVFCIISSNVMRSVFLRGKNDKNCSKNITVIQKKKGLKELKVEMMYNKILKKASYRAPGLFYKSETE